MAFAHNRCAVNRVQTNARVGAGETPQVGKRSPHKREDLRSYENVRLAIPGVGGCNVEAPRGVTANQLGPVKSVSRRFSEKLFLEVRQKRN